MSRPPTPSQTIGPFFALAGAGALPWPDGPYVVPDGTPGAFRLQGRVLDGAGAPVPDGLVEAWQADPDGRFAHPDDPRGAVERPGFRGFGRCATDADGRFFILTVKPGVVPAPDGRPQAPHLDLSVFARAGVSQVAVPYDITKISHLADELESSWHRMFLLADKCSAGRPENFRSRLRRTLTEMIRSEIDNAGAGSASPQFRQSTRQLA